MELDCLDDFYKRVFLFYRETGMRLAEPMISVLDGAWIDIPNTSKSKVGRNIELDTSMQSIFNELKDWLENGYGSRLKTPDDHISKMFKKTLRSIGADEGKHFHSLRHTFAVRRLIQGTSIYDLKLLMGHSSVTTTEVYSNMNLTRVAQDFPTIVKSYVNAHKIVSRVCAENSFNLIETIGNRIIEEMRSRYSVDFLIVRIRKPSVPIQ